MRKSKLTSGTTAGLKSFTNHDFAAGDAAVGYVQSVEDDFLWMTISPHVRGRLPAKLATLDSKVRKALNEHFKVGQCINCVVRRAPKRTQALLLAAVDVVGSVDTSSLPKPGDKVTGTVYRMSEADGLWMQLAPKVQGRVFLTNLSDKYGKSPLDKYEVGMTVKCHVLGSVSHADRKGSKEKSKGSECAQLELSTRKSHMHGVGAVSDPVISSFADVADDTVYQGYVVNTTDNGCFVALGPEVVGRVQISHLSDLFIKDFRAAFVPGMRVKARVLSIDRKKKRVELSLKPSVVEPEKFAAPVTLTSLNVGDKVKGAVKRTESYGVFVKLENSSLVGMCHISEVSTEFIANLSEVLTPGDRVKAKVIKIDPKSQKISLSLKAEHFADDVDSDEDDEEGVSEGIAAAAAADDGSSYEEDSEDDGEEGDDDDDNSGDASAQVDMSESDDDRLGAAGASDDDGVVLRPSGAKKDTSGERSERKRKRTLADAPALQVAGGFFDDNDNDDAEDGDKLSEDESSDDDEEEDVSKKKSKRAKRSAKRAEEEELAAKEQELLDDSAEPESAAAFDRLLLGEPNNSYIWVKYMAFHLQMAEIDQAREVADRALKAISVREEEERMNVWIAKLNLENTYGTSESLTTTFDEAQRMNDSLKMHHHMASILERSGKEAETEEHFQTMIRRFKSELKVWVNYGGFKMRCGKTEQARVVLQQSLKVLPKHEHVAAVTKFGLLDFKNGEIDRGRTLFENLLSNYPKRIDLWNVYIDQELRVGDQPAIRALFDRVTALALSSKKMKFFFKRYLEYEKTEGDEEAVEHVMQRAREYVESKMQ